MFSEDDDQEQKVALTLVLGVAIFVAVGVIGLAGLSGKFSMGQSAENPAVTAHVTQDKSITGEVNKDTTVAATTAPIAATATSIANLKDDESAFIVENGMVKFYFASGKSDLAAGGKEALADVVKGIKAGQKASISGYHDTTGDPAKNTELAKKRAMSVRDTLIALGVTENQLELKKPEQAQGSGNNSEARRVEVTLIK